MSLGDAVAQEIQRTLYGRDPSLLPELVGFATPEELLPVKLATQVQKPSKSRRG